MPATPVLSNGGTKRGLPISCFLNEASDSLGGILDFWSAVVSVVVAGGASGIGLTAISIALAMQIKCIATVGSDEKYKYLKDLGLERVINYNLEDFESILWKLGEGIINHPSGSHIRHDRERYR